MADSTFTVTIEGLDKLDAAFKKAPQIAEPIYQDAINRSGAILANHTDPSTVPWITGTLSRSFMPVEIGRLYARWYPRVNYAMAVQFGMPPSPGRYVPAIGKRLVNGKNIGMWPGFAGRHYMEKIRSASVDEINQAFRIALQNVTVVISKS